MNFQMFKLFLEKVEEPEIKLTISAWSKKQESSRKSSISALLTMPKPASWEIGMQVMKKQNRTQATDWFQIGKAVCPGCILSHYLFNLCPEYLIRNTGLKEHRLEKRLLGEMSITSDVQMTPHLWQKWRRTKESFDESERGEWKIWLKAQHSEN